MGSSENVPQNELNLYDYPLSNIEIDQIMADIDNFAGVFIVDDSMILTGKISKDESGIINLGEAKTGGTHWVAYYNGIKSRRVEYFDSFGLIPDKRISEYLKSSGKNILYNTTTLQGTNSAICGWYAIYFIKQRNNGRSMRQILSDFKPYNSTYNDGYIIQFAKNILTSY